MYAFFIQKFQSMLFRDEIKTIILNVFHDLQPDDFDWAVKLFQQTGNIDSFAIALQKIGIEVISPQYQLEHNSQKIDPGVMEFIDNCLNLFYGRRYGSEILAQAIPFDVRSFLNVTEDQNQTVCSLPLSIRP